jgi:hypothetical protein
MQTLPPLSRDCIGQGFLHRLFAAMTRACPRHGACLLIFGFAMETSMSISVNASSTLNPALAAMLSQLTPSSGGGKAQVSSDILNLFSQMHQAAGSTHAGGGAGASGGTSGSTSTISSASTMMSPLDQLMAAIDMTDDTEDGASSTQTQYVDPNTLLPDSSS